MSVRTQPVFDGCFAPEGPDEPEYTCGFWNPQPMCRTLRLATLWNPGP